jgi:tyrosine-protein kinase Etk/Wzc
MIEDSSGRFNLWKMLLVLARRKVFITVFVLLCTAGAVVIALVLPKWYRAKASILPTQSDQQLGISGSFAQFTMSSAGFELPIMATPSDVYATMLQSETVRRAVIGELDLKRYFDTRSLHELLLYLDDKTDIKVTGEGVVQLYFEDKDPEMAARIANAYIKHLDGLNREVRAGKAKSDKEFIFNRLVSTRAKLDTAQAQLLQFQNDNNAVDLEKQRDLAINAAADIKTQLALTRVSLDVRRRSYSADHPDVRRLELEVEELERQLAALEKGDGKKSFLNLPLSEIPGLSMRYADLKAEVVLQEKVYSLLTEMHEEARIKEQKDTPTISVLEIAYPPEIKYKPKRAIIVLAAFIASLALAILIALFADYLENLRRTSPSDFELMNQVRKRLTGKTGYTDS